MLQEAKRFFPRGKAVSFMEQIKPNEGFCVKHFSHVFLLVNWGYQSDILQVCWTIFSRVINRPIVCEGILEGL